jgi:hypothetical protein
MWEEMTKIPIEQIVTIVTCENGDTQISGFESAGGDSGAPIDKSTGNIYHGSVSGHSGGYTFYVPWSNIKANLGL